MLVSLYPSSTLRVLKKRNARVRHPVVGADDGVDNEKFVFLSDAVFRASASSPSAALSSLRTDSAVTSNLREVGHKKTCQTQRWTKGTCADGHRNTHMLSVCFRWRRRHHGILISLIRKNLKQILRRCYSNLNENILTKSHTEMWFGWVEYSCHVCGGASLSKGMHLNLSGFFFELLCHNRALFLHEIGIHTMSIRVPIRWGVASA